MRAENDAVLVGVNTILNDDPELTVRNVKGINPVRVVLDSKLSTPINAKVINHDGKCIILTSENASPEKTKTLEDKGVKIFRLPVQNNKIDLKLALELLASQGILTLMVEGGPEVLSSFLREGLADYVNLFFAPRILGEGRGFNFNMNFSEIKDAFELDEIKTCRLNQDFMIEGLIKGGHVTETFC